MQFLSDVFVPCPICEGKRFKPEVLAIQWNGKSVADLLQTTVSEAMVFFAGQASIRSRFTALEAVGLGYLPLGQPLNTLSGGESQRLKLVRYLSGYAADSGAEASGLGSQPRTDGALLLLDEPTTGLHRHDVKRLLEVLQRIVDRGHSVIVIEHNLDVLKSADWILEVGPDAGAQGGRVIAEGPPEQLIKADTATTPFLREALNCSAGSPDPASSGYQAGSGDPALQLAAEEAAPYQAGLTMNAGELTVIGARENNLKNISVS